MKVYLVDSTMEFMNEITQQWSMRRAVVISHNPEAALHMIRRAIAGEEVFSNLADDGKFSRPGDKPVFDPNRCTVVEVGAAIADLRGSRILSWELVQPETESPEGDVL